MVSRQLLLVLALVTLCSSRASEVCAAGDVKIVGLKPGVEVRKSPGDWEDAEIGMTLTEGYEISTDPDGKATLVFGDSSTVLVRPGTQIKIASFFTKGGVVATEIFLKMGELAAKVRKSDNVAKSDFKIRSPTATASVRGTEMRRVIYTPTTGMVVVMATGSLDLRSLEGTTVNLAKTDSGGVNEDGKVEGDQQVKRKESSSSAYASGASDAEVDQIEQANSEPTPTGDQGSTGIVDEVTDTTNNQFTAIDRVTRQVGINVIDQSFNGFTPGDALQGAIARTAAGGSSVVPPDGSVFAALGTGASGVGQSFSVGSTVASPSFLDVSFEYNVIASGTPGVGSGQFTAELIHSGGSVALNTTDLIADQARFRPFIPTGNDTSNLGLTGGSIAYQTGFETVTTRVSNVSGPISVQFGVSGGPGVSAAVDNVSVVATPMGAGIVP